MFTRTATAQDAIQLPLFDGAMVLTAEAGLRQDMRAPDGALVEFWRPIAFGTPDKPLAGRMDCQLGGVRQPYSDALFDIRQRYRDERAPRERNGLVDEDDSYTEEGGVRRLEVTGHANRPHRHYVLTYLAYRADPFLYDVRLNCEFRHLQEPGERTDYASLMRRYVDIGIPVAAAQTANPAPDSQ